MSSSYKGAEQKTGNNLFPPTQLGARRLDRRTWPCSPERPLGHLLSFFRCPVANNEPTADLKFSFSETWPVSI